MRGLPPRARVHAADVICVSRFLVSVVYPLALTPLEPALLAIHPILVETVLGTTESFVTAGAFARVSLVPLWLAIAAPVLGGDILDPFSWWLGRRYRERLLDLGKRGERFRAPVVRAEGLFRRWGPWALVLAYYLPVPNAVIYVAAGESGMSLVWFVILDLIGTALGVVPVILLGFLIGQSAVSLAELMTRYAGISTVVLIVLVVGGYVWRARASR